MSAYPSTRTRARRGEVRKSIPRRRAALPAGLTRRQATYGCLLLAAFVLATSLIALRTRQQPPFRPGELVTEPAVARVRFSAVDREKTEAARRRAKKEAPAVYALREAFLNRVENVRTLPATLSTAETVDQVAEDVRRRFGIESDRVLSAIQAFEKNGTPTDGWTQRVAQWKEALLREPILPAKRYQIEQTDLAPAIRLAAANRSVRDEALINFARTDQVRSTVREAASVFPKPVADVVVAYLMRAGEPPYGLDEEATEALKRQAAEAVEPVRKAFQPGQVIVAAGERLTNHQFSLLKREQEKYLSSLTLRRLLLHRGSVVAVILFVALGLAAYVVAYKPRVATNPVRGLALVGLFLAGVSIGWFTWSTGTLRATFGPATLLAPGLLVAMIVAIAYDQRFALGAAAAQCVLMGVALQISLPTTLALFAPSAVAVAQLRQLRHRSTMGRVGLLAGLTAAAMVGLTGLLDKPQGVEGLPAMLGWYGFWSLTTGLLAGFLVLGVLPFIERVFKVTTEMSLLELCDVNQPLLRRLAQEAPGTYNHSLTLAVLAESAAESVGAHGLLCRVGAYYHDIGKTHKPQYFVENQGSSASRHSKLSPAMSLLIIVGHVKDGVEMAREYGLPKILHHFIESHHGTTLVEYFYHAAKEQRGQRDQPSEFEFRYPGPKPQTREAAILMLCDSVEGAARAMRTPTPAKIEHLVHSMATKRLMDGQFDQCDLTLRELKQIEDAIVRSLSAIHHGRIVYPGQEAEGERTDRRPAV